MRFRIMISAALGAALLFSGEVRARTEDSRFWPRVGLIVHDNVAVRSAPNSRARVQTRLVQQTQVVVLGGQRHWLRISFWGAVRGWVPGSEVAFRRPWPVGSTYHAPEVRTAIHARPPTALGIGAVAEGEVLLRSRPGGQVTGSRPRGSRFRLDAWQQDARGRIWYRSDGSWAEGENVQFSWPRGAHPTSRGWRFATEKGMWLTLGSITSSTPAAILDAARHDGITHLYLEAAISPLGFHGKGSVGPLIDAAHRRRVAVIAWVYPYLSDIASDVALTREVAAFQTPAGNGFDGVAADLERNVRLSTVREYSQLVRAYLGSSYPMIGVTYPPQSFPGYPYGEVAHDYDVIAPMDYWHETKTSKGTDYGGLAYGTAYGYRYAADSIRGIRSEAPHIPIAPIGQAFDDFGRLEMGPYAPSGPEIVGFLNGSRSNGAVGVSFFQWMTVTVPEWAAIRAFRY